MVLSSGVMRLLSALCVCLLLLMLAKYARGDVTTAQPENETSISTSNMTSSTLITITNQSSVQSITPSSTSSTESNPTGSQNASSSPYTPSSTFIQTSTEYLFPKYPTTTPLLTANTKNETSVTPHHLPGRATSNWASSWMVQGFLLLSMILPAVVL